MLAALVLAAGFAAGAGAGVRSGGEGGPAVAFSGDEIAPAEVCPGQAATELSASQQARVMLCMTNYAREVNGLHPLRPSRQLGRAAERKSADIVSCDEFSHEACGRRFTFWDQRYGYLKGCWRAAENIAWGTGTDATVGAIFTAWLQSTEHHENILGPYREVGIGLRVGGVEGYEEAAVWTQDFGSHEC